MELRAVEGKEYLYTGGPTPQVIRIGAGQTSV
jgi:hypothetical protein